MNGYTSKESNNTIFMHFCIPSQWGSALKGENLLLERVFLQREANKNHIVCLPLKNGGVRVHLKNGGVRVHL